MLDLVCLTALSSDPLDNKKLFVQRRHAPCNCRALDKLSARNSFANNLGRLVSTTLKGMRQLTELRQGWRSLTTGACRPAGGASQAGKLTCAVEVSGWETAGSVRLDREETGRGGLCVGEKDYVTLV